MNKAGRPRTDSSVRDRAIEMYVSGLPVVRIAHTLNVGASSIGRWAREEGLPPRPRGGPRTPGSSTYRDAEIALRGGQWVRDGLVYRWAAA